MYSMTRKTEYTARSSGRLSRIPDLRFPRAPVGGVSGAVSFRRVVRCSMVLGMLAPIAGCGGGMVGCADYIEPGMDGLLWVGYFDVGIAIEVVIGDAVGYGREERCVGWWWLVRGCC